MEGVNRSIEVLDSLSPSDQSTGHADSRQFLEAVVVGLDSLGHSKERRLRGDVEIRLFSPEGPADLLRWRSLRIISDRRGSNQ